MAVVVAIGRPGSGKSRYLGRIAAARVHAGARVLAYCPYRSDAARRPEALAAGAWYADGARMYSDACEGILPRVAVAYRPEDLDNLGRAAIRVRPCILWLDEMFDVCTPRRWCVESFRRLWGSFRHEGVDLWCCFYRPADVPVSVRGNATITLLFRLEELPDLKYVRERMGEGYARTVKALEEPTWRPLIYPPNISVDKNLMIRHSTR